MSDQRQVVMRFSISGGRADGRNWPDAGDPLVLGRDEAEDLIRGGMAYPHPDGYEVADDAVPPPSPEPGPPPPEPVQEAGPPQPEEAGEPAVPAGPPVAYAPKQAWVDWAMANGASEDEANMATKAQLMETYGERP